jgi:hypothetical protein
VQYSSIESKYTYLSQRTSTIVIVQPQRVKQHQTKLQQSL